MILGFAKWIWGYIGAHGEILPILWILSSNSKREKIKIRFGLPAGIWRHSHHRAVPAACMGWLVEGRLFSECPQIFAGVKETPHPASVAGSFTGGVGTGWGHKRLKHCVRKRPAPFFEIGMSEKKMGRPKSVFLRPKSVFRRPVRTRPASLWSCTFFWKWPCWSVVRVCPHPFHPFYPSFAARNFGKEQIDNLTCFHIIAPKIPRKWQQTVFPLRNLSQA